MLLQALPSLVLYWVASEQGLGPEGTWIEVVEAEVTTPEDTDSEPEDQDEVRLG